jgi:hydrogenase maturation protease
MTARALVACVGNIFLRDDGFGTEVARALARRELPGEVRVVDYGIGAVHLVYELLNGYDVLVLVDTVGQQDGPPGTLYVIEPDVPSRDRSGDPFAAVPLDPHDLQPAGAMSLAPSLGGSVDRIVVVGCQPASVDDGIGLSDAVRASVEPAAQLVVDVVRRELANRRTEASAG